MSIPKNSWYCSTCDFYVFNTKRECKKCLSQRPQPKCDRYSSYCPEFDKKLCEYFEQQYLEAETTCVRCQQEGRIYNKEPKKSNHKCHKYK